MAASIVSEVRPIATPALVGSSSTSFSLVDPKESRHLAYSCLREKGPFSRGGFNEIFTAISQEIRDTILVYRKEIIGLDATRYYFATQEIEFLQKLVDLRKLGRLPPFLPEIFDAQIFTTGKDPSNLAKRRLGVLMRYYSRGDLLSQLEMEGQKWRSVTEEERGNICRSRIDQTRYIIQSVMYFHNMGYVNRDIKLTNFLISNDGIPLLNDFGAVCKEFSRNVVQCGTPLYAPPESFQIGAPVSKAFDVWSLGITLCRVLHPLFESEVSDPFYQAIDSNSESAPLGRLSRIPETKSTNPYLRLLSSMIKINPEERMKDLGQWFGILNGGVSTSISVPPITTTSCEVAVQGVMAPSMQPETAQARSLYQALPGLSIADRVQFAKEVIALFTPSASFPCLESYFIREGKIEGREASNPMYTPPLALPNKTLFPSDRVWILGITLANLLEPILAEENPRFHDQLETWNVFFPKGASQENPRPGLLALQTPPLTEPQEEHSCSRFIYGMLLPYAIKRTKPKDILPLFISVASKY